MDDNTPQANNAPPAAPRNAAGQQAPPPPLGQASPAPGAVQPQIAPPARRSRAPRGPVPASSSSGSSGAPALLELGAAIPMATIQRRVVNMAIPDANHLFHVLSLCDSAMNSTHRFLQSAPAWIPIVSQLYISVLWTYHTMSVGISSGYTLFHSNLFRNLTEYLRIDECLIPGPLVPFFESIAAVNGPFDWMGDVTSVLPSFSELWNPDTFLPLPDARIRLPFPVVLLDQLAYFATWTVPAQQSVYGNFEWYRNVFSVASSANTNRFRNLILGPNGVGSLYSTESQVNAARTFWNAALGGFTRVNSAAGQAVFNNTAQLLGFSSQAGEDQINWFQHVTIVMQEYCKFFNGSRALKTVSPTGLGAFEVVATAQANTRTRDWLYPQALPGPFLSSVFAAPHELTSAIMLDFRHNDHELEEVAEQYAVVTSTNIRWSTNNATQHGRTAYNDGNAYSGDLWAMTPHRQVTSVNILAQYAQVLISRYHQTTATRAS